MAKVPPPTPADGDCICIGGVMVCPHVVHLTPAQLVRVKKMHAANVARARKAKKKKSKNSKKRKLAKKSA